MAAIRKATGDSTSRKVDAAEIATNLNIDHDFLARWIHDLAKLGLLERRPKRNRPHLVTITAKVVDLLTN